MFSFLKRMVDGWFRKRKAMAMLKEIENKNRYEDVVSQSFGVKR